MITLDDIKRMDKELLTVQDVAKLLKVNGTTIRRAAREHPETLGFPVMLFGKQVRIPRRAFVRFLEGGGGGDG